MVDKETPADKAKREAAEKAEAEKQGKQEPEDNNLSGDALKEAERIMAGDDESESWMANFKNAEQSEAARKAASHLYAIACEFPQSTPDTHTVFGFGGKLFRLGDLRALFGMRRG